MEPYLTGEIRDAFDRWLEATLGRFIPPLTFSEVRKGVRALSSLYVERREEGHLASRALEGRGKRAAFATYYAALHFLATWHAAVRAGESLGEVRRVLDLGCGSGAAGAAAATALGAGQVVGVDRSGWALAEARRTYSAFSLAGRTRRGSLPGAMPRCRPGDLLVAGWVANELAGGSQEALLAALLEARRRGTRILLLAPLAGAASPWWGTWAPRFAAEGISAQPLKRSLALPAWVAQMDRAAGLSHQPLGARVLAG